MAAKIYLAAGHYGSKTGANYPFGDEGKLTIEFRNLVAKHLKDRGREYYTDKDNISLTAVINDINKKLTSADYAIEFHFDASKDNNKNGCSVFVSSKAGIQTKMFAEEMSRIVSQFLDVRNNGMKSEILSQHKTLGFVSKTKPHAVLIELCHISNKEDMEQYQKNKDKLAMAIAVFLNMK